MQSNGILGPRGHSECYVTGYKKILKIDLESETPVQHLTYEGDPGVRAGDTIEAYIIKGKMEDLPFPEPPANELYPSLRGEKTSVLIEGEFTKKMQAYRIDIIENDVSVKTDFSMNYPK